MDKPPKPDADLAYGLYTGVYKPKVVHIALQLDVFAPLIGGAKTTAAVAQACQCDTVGIKRLLDYLASVKLLEQHGDAYGLTPTADAFFVRGRKSYVGDLVLAFTGMAPWESILQSIRSGEPRQFDYELYFAQDAWLESYSTWRIAKSLEMWAAAGIAPAQHTRLRVLDIACGCAIKSLVLAQKSPGVHVTCFDTEGVLGVARALAQRMQVSAQVSFTVGDLLSAQLGNAQFDACLCGQITHYLTEQQDRDLFHRIRAALMPGGILVLDVPMATEELTESASFLSLVLWANSGGRAHSSATYHAWLLDAGFREITQLGERWLTATK